MTNDNFVFDVNKLQEFYETNFWPPTTYHIVGDIIKYVAAQVLDKEETIDALYDLLYSSGITKEEIVQAVEGG